MNIRIYDTYDQMSRAAADFVIAQLLLKPESHIGLTAGKTPRRHVRRTGGQLSQRCGRLWSGNVL
ncbi:MAG: hypothetical protein ACLSHJ_07285 [Oscillospiraceae bacterium]